VSIMISGILRGFNLAHTKYELTTFALHMFSEVINSDFKLDSFGFVSSNVYHYYYYSGLENRDYGDADHVAPSISKIADNWSSLGRCSSLTDSGHGVSFRLVYYYYYHHHHQ
jgi:hypothetical protein